MSMFDGFNARYHKEMREEIEALTDAICGGNANDFAEYRRMVGKLNGLKYALERHVELLTLMEQANDK
jgi:hypothetical protein